MPDTGTDRNPKVLSGGSMLTPGLSAGIATAVNAVPPSTANGTRVTNTPVHPAPVMQDFAALITQSEPSGIAVLTSSRRLEPDTLGSVIAREPSSRAVRIGSMNR
ncbi:hypothetical protein MSHO_60650 [Mycobacterium shottsii]|uniref:Uncharacterized protein n=1 Tax=Mycobacterium shottsii TaxID=133549 RepID=A0A7I7LM96_9MYCO|nr:hypothetical protein MSHO_60650 [Mycobacterium shottsii]